MHSKIAVLTGGGGYIGNRLTKHLSSEGWGLILVVRSGSSINSYPDTPNCRFVEYDGTQSSLNNIKVDSSLPVVFFHLATSAYINNELTGVDELLASNILFGTHLLAYMAENKLSNIVVAESYWQFDEVGRLNGNTLYSAAKSAFSFLLQYFTKYNMSSISLVLYDVYGPVDNRGKLINALIDSANSQSEIELTSGKQLLDYVFIDDVVRAFCVAGDSLLASVNKGGSFNRYTVRSMEERNLQEYVEIMGQVLGCEPPVLWGRKQYPSHQIMKPWFPSKSEQLPGWNARFTFYDGIKSISKDE
ncbi:MAG: NAD-dependent epimerase/dehydratase family protein [Bermanella sp.]